MAPPPFSGDVSVRLKLIDPVSARWRVVGGDEKAPLEIEDEREVAGEAERSIDVDATRSGEVRVDVDDGVGVGAAVVAMVSRFSSSTRSAADWVVSGTTSTRRTRTQDDHG